MRRLGETGERWDVLAPLRDEEEKTWDMGVLMDDAAADDTEVRIVVVVVVVLVCSLAGD